MRVANAGVCGKRIFEREQGLLVEEMTRVTGVRYFTWMLLDDKWQRLDLQQQGAG